MRKEAVELWHIVRMAGLRVAVLGLLGVVTAVILFQAFGCYSEPTTPESKAAERTASVAEFRERISQPLQLGVKVSRHSGKGENFSYEVETFEIKDPDQTAGDILIRRVALGLRERLGNSVSEPSIVIREDGTRAWEIQALHDNNADVLVVIPGKRFALVLLANAKSERTGIASGVAVELSKILRKLRVQSTG